MPAQKSEKQGKKVAVGSKRKMVHQGEPAKKMKLNSGEALMRKPILDSKVKGKKGKKKQISKLIGRRRRDKKSVEYLVRWEGQGPEHDSWLECTEVFRCESGKEYIKDFLDILRANAPKSFAVKMAPVLLDFNDGTPKRKEKNATYIKVTNQPLSEDSVNTPPVSKKKLTEAESSGTKSKRSSSRHSMNRKIELPSVCEEVSAKWSEIGRSRAAIKAKKLASKIKSSKAQAVKTLQKKQLKKGPGKGPGKGKKMIQAAKNSKLWNTADTKAAKKSQVKKSATSGDGYATVSSCSSSESGVLYSLATGMEEAAGDGSNNSRKRLFLETGYDPASESSVGTPDTDPEISFKNSPRKRMLLKDSIRPKSESGCVGLEIVTPATPASHPSPYRTPPSSPGGAGPSIQTPPLANRASTAMAEFAPSSPAAATYMKSITASLQQKKKKGGGSDSGSSSQDRRVSVRQSEGVFKYKEIVVKKISGYTQILLYSQTQVKNALNPAVIHELKQVLHSAKYDDTRVVLLSGSGSTFCSGVDLHYLTEGDRRQRAQRMADAVKELVNAFINFPKPIVVAVNGPAVGLGVAMLPLCDIVYASDKATFYCPYGRLGQTPEGAASYTFPTGLGLAMANDLLLAGRRLTATQAMQAGLVSQVFWPTNVMDEVVTRVLKMAEHATSTAAAKALELSKMLIRGPVKAKLIASNDSETAVLTERWTAPDCQMLIRSYVNEEQHLFL